MALALPTIKRGGPEEQRHVDDVAPAAALRRLLGWDLRHDAMVRLVTDEFALALPRDRELIRQLAFIRVQQGAAHVMPFGKYKGRLLEEILTDDPSYLDWIVEQSWFRSEFPALHRAVINLDATEMTS